LSRTERLFAVPPLLLPGEVKGSDRAGIVVKVESAPRRGGVGPEREPAREIEFPLDRFQVTLHLGVGGFQPGHAHSGPGRHHVGYLVWLDPGPPEPGKDSPDDVDPIEIVPKIPGGEEEIKLPGVARDVHGPFHEGTVQVFLRRKGRKDALEDFHDVR
jgi:hypothetical protein